jgi:hypothetical protein
MYVCITIIVTGIHIGDTKIVTGMGNYIGIRHQGGEDDDTIVSTSLRTVTEYLGVSERKVGYRFTVLRKRFWMQLDPWISIWQTGEVVKQSRPQYRNNTFTGKG